MSIPSLLGWLAGERVSAAKLTLHTKTAIEASVYYKPYCKITNTATQLFANNTTQTGNDCTMNSVLDDTDGIADLANNRLLIVTPGLYRLHAQVAWAANATGVRYGQILVNGAIRSGGNVPGVTGSPIRFHMTGEERLNAGDLVTLRMGQNSGASLNSDTGYRGCFLVAEWMSL